MKVFAWDFHGTLEEGVEVGFWHILKQLAKEHKIPEDFQLVEVRKLYGTSVASYLRHFFPSAGDSTVAAMMKRVADIQNQHHLRKFVKPAPGAIETLRKISAAGHKNIVLSNSHPDHINPLIDVVGMREFVAEVFAIDRHYTHKNVDPVVEKTKLLKKLKARYKLQKGELIAIGDRVTDINAGIAAGAITYQYVRRGFPTDETSADFKISKLTVVLREIS